MVFFNYSTMQMAAKIVYYGPGLCGKTTNLQYVYGHTSGDSRGEMVSLETETDRTLFFDLLPIDVGTIAGFKTKIQLYTVPGQVFYNTTRKLVLKGVDGVVFVADSQRPMLQANVDALANLEENLAEIGLTLDEVPIVLQFNKRDLKDVLSVEELNDSLNREQWQYHEASAIAGTGVFETLKGISKLTLMSIKQKMQKGAPRDTGAGAAAAATPPPRPAQSSPPGPPVASPAAPSPAPSPAPPVAAAVRPARPLPPQPQPESGSSAAEQPASPAQVATATPTITSEPVSPPQPNRQVDILAELEKIRRQATSREQPAEEVATNGLREVSHEIRHQISRSALARARRVTLMMRVEDEANEVVDTLHDQLVFERAPSLEELLLKLHIALESKD